MRCGLHLGVVVDEHRLEFGRGDFLVRNLLGVDQDTGALAVGDRLEVGQTVQFHVRDADRGRRGPPPAAEPVEGEAALLFTCNGRGTRFFGVPDHDAASVEDLLGPVPLAGAFCAGRDRPDRRPQLPARLHRERRRLRRKSRSRGPRYTVRRESRRRRLR